MLIECHNCGAPLDVADGAPSVRCHYCGQSAETGRNRTVALQTPQGWVPPQQWTPTVGSFLPQEPLAYRPVAAARAVLRWVGISTFLTLALGGFMAAHVLGAVNAATAGAGLGALTQSAQVQNAMGQALSAMNALSNSAMNAGARFDTLPIMCGGNDSVTLTGKNLVLASGVPIVASGNCTIHLVGCTVSGATAIVAKGNATVTVEGGSLSGTGPAVVLTENASIDVSGGVRLSGESTVTASGNSRGQIRDSSVSGRRVAIHTSGNASMDTTGSTVQGQVLGRRH